MGMEMIAKIRRFVIGKAGVSPITVRATATESLAVAMVESEGTEMTRAGRRFFLGRNAAVTGIAPVAAQVTTAAQWVIWNADSNKSYVIDHLGAVLVSGVAAAGAILDACLFQAPVSSGSSATGMSVASASNGGPSSRAIVTTNVTITGPTAPVWFTVAKTDSTNTAVLSVSLVNYDLRGRIIIPPGQGLGLAVYSGTGTSPLFAPVACWNEIELDLE